MYFIYVNTDAEAVSHLENVLTLIDQKMLLLAVPNGYDLIQFLQNVKRGETYPDLIILSLNMSRIDGKELLELLKIDDIYCLIPIVMFLPELGCPDEVYCKNLGAETIRMPSELNDWVSAARTMCAVCH